MLARPSHSTDERGQILVIFVLAMFVIIGGVGLVLDGGSVFAQKRDEQNVADLAAVAGATAYLNTTGTTSAKEATAVAAARQIAAQNRYPHDPANGVTVNVSFPVSNGVTAQVRVDLGAPHRNNFAGLMGMPSWGVAVQAVALTSSMPNGAHGAMPLIFNEEAFPGAVCDENAGPCTPEVYQLPGNSNEDVPQDATQFNWTIFCTANGNPCNGNSDGVRDLIEGNGTDTVVTLNMDIGPLNAGAHTTLFGALEAHIGGKYPVPVVTDDGNMIGWAYFKITGVEGANEKVVRGYFASPVNATNLTVVNNGGTASLSTGVFVVKLVD